MADESQNQLPTSPILSTVTSAYDALRKNTLEFGQKAFESVNAIPAPASVPTVALPQLTESKRTGYRAGKPLEIVCCQVGAFLVEKNAAYDYILMSNAAAKDGIRIPINSGFRTMAEQTALYNERKNPEVAKEKGVAAFPGTSNHQSGIALDINVGMKKSDYIAGNFSAAYLWMEKYAKEFGFDHVEGAKVNEPWHWTHLEARIVGKAAYQSATGFAVLTNETAINAAASDQLGTTRLLNLIGHDETTSHARSKTMTRMTRATAYKENAEFYANKSNYVGTVVSQLEAAKLTLEVEPKGFPLDSVRSLSYNFTTGLWGDNKAV